MTDYTYVGQELEHFSRAKNWKSYFRSHIDPYLGDEVLEVGAGIGGTTRLLNRRMHRRWVCLEPDGQLAFRLREGQAVEPLGTADCQVVVGSLASQLHGQQFDSILYIDVLEHIEADREELQRASALLKPDGFLIVLSPSHQWLFTDFDRAVGHWRRYSRSTLA